MADISRYQARWVAAGEINIDNKAFQFRKDITPESVAKLAKSMAEDGQKFPILVWQRHSGEKQLISGFRRVTAAKSLNWEKVLALEIPESELSEQEALRLNFVENMERKSLSNLDIMFACKKLKEDDYTNEEIGELIGKSDKQVRRYLKVADASADVQDKVKSGEITLKQAADEKTGPGAGFAKMAVKSTRTGFNVILKYNRNKDDAKAAIEFLNKVLERLKGEVAKAGNRENGKGDEGQAANGTASQPSDTVEIRQILIEGRCRGKAGDVLELRVAGYDKDSNKVDPGVLNPVWDVSNSAVAELIQTSGAAVKLKLKACGTCFVHVKHGDLKTSAGIEVLN